MAGETTDSPSNKRALQKFVKDNEIPVVFPIEYRYVNADDIPLSPFFERQSVTVSVHMAANMKAEDKKRYFEGAEAILRKHGGRPHWGKEHTLESEDVAALYPKLADFLEVRNRLDPGRCLVNDYAARVLGA